MIDTSHFIQFTTVIIYHYMYNKSFNIFKTNESAETLLFCFVFHPNSFNFIIRVIIISSHVSTIYNQKASEYI